MDADSKKRRGPILWLSEVSPQILVILAGLPLIEAGILLGVYHVCDALKVLPPSDLGSEDPFGPMAAGLLVTNYLAAVRMKAGSRIGVSLLSTVIALVVYIALRIRLMLF